MPALRLFQRVKSLLTGFHTGVTGKSTGNTTINHRHVAILSFIEQQGGELKQEQRLQKFAFLTDQSLETGSLYNYRQYDYGPYSRQLKRDTQWLADSDLISIRKDKTFGGRGRRTYSLTETGEHALDVTSNASFSSMNGVLDTTEQIVSEHGDKSINPLIEYVRERHPVYWENSVYRTRV